MKTKISLAEENTRTLLGNIFSQVVRNNVPYVSAFLVLLM